MLLRWPIISPDIVGQPPSSVYHLGIIVNCDMVGNPSQGGPDDDVGDEKQKVQDLRQTISNELPVHRGVSIPSHMKTPGQDGYRTPTVEDYEIHLRSQSHHREKHLSVAGPSSPAAASNQCPGVTHRSHFNTSFVPLVPILEKLQWNERIRHFTWSWFTLTMSTGGIANVLYNGRCRGLER